MAAQTRRTQLSAGGSRIGRFLRKYGKHYLGLAPFLIFFGVFILWPMLYGLVMSFFDWSTRLNTETHFVGLDNFLTVLSPDTQQGQRF